MLRTRLAAMALLAVLASCGSQPGQAPAPPTADSAVTSAVPPVAAPGEAGGGEAPAPRPGEPGATGASFIAYSWRWAFELPARAVLPTLTAHRRLCDEMGPQRCQLIASSVMRGEGEAVEARLELKVAPGEAAGFGQKLEETVAAARGRTLSSEVTGEDLTRQIIDAEAALKAKRTLRDRLQALLEERDGKLADLLETEKALAETQAELDAATALLAELRRRVDLSAVTISYRSTLPLGLDRGRPLADAWAEAGHTLSSSLASLLTLVVAALPWAALVGLGVAGARAWRRRRG